MRSFVRDWQCYVRGNIAPPDTSRRATSQRLFLAVGHWQERPATVKACVSIHPRKTDGVWRDIVPERLFEFFKFTYSRPNEYLRNHRACTKISSMEINNAYFVAQNAVPHYCVVSVTRCLVECNKKFAFYS